MSLVCTIMKPYINQAIVVYSHAYTLAHRAVSFEARLHVRVLEEVSFGARLHSCNCMTMM